VDVVSAAAILHTASMTEYNISEEMGSAQMTHSLRNNVSIMHQIIRTDRAILQKPLQQRGFFRLAKLARIHLSTYLVNASTDELQKYINKAEDKLTKAANLSHDAV
jgi:hypothetical protein